MTKTETVVLLLLLGLLQAVVTEASSKYNPDNLPKLRSIPPWKMIQLTSVSTRDDNTGWFCVYLNFKNTAWDYPSGATQYAGWAKINEAKSYTSVTSNVSTVDYDASAGTNEIIWSSTVTNVQREYSQNQLLSFTVCGAKQDQYSTAAATSFTYTAQLLLTVDFRPPPYPYPTFPGWVLASSDFNDCFPSFDSSLLNWDIFVTGDVKYADHAILGGKVAAGGRVFTQTLNAKVGSDLSSCPTTCSGLTTNNSIYLVAGNFIQFNVNSNGICGGFAQGNASIPAASTLAVDQSCPQTTGSVPVDFSSVKAKWTAISTALSQKNPTVASGYSINAKWGGSLTLYFSSKFEDFIFYIPGDFISDNGVYLLRAINPENIANGRSFIFNIAGSYAVLNINMSLLFTSDIASKVVFNFFQATSLYLGSGSYYGTILAPNADLTVTGETTVYGQIVAKSLYVSFGYIHPKNYIGFTSYSGACLSCATGYYGSSCTKCSCAYNQNCQDGVTGDGTCVCFPHFDDACQNCQNGWFGMYCNKTCTATCLARGICSDGVNGTGDCLSCNSPFNGTECETCINTRYGSDCTGVCKSVCFTKNGTCDYGVNGTGLCATCGSPWGNGAQDLCEDCDTSHYGPTCENSCTATCAKHGTCSHGLTGNGTCLSCRSIYKGTECQECVSGYYGPDCLGNCTATCLQYGTCNDGASGDGGCSNCKNGTTGGQCDECIVSGNYGTNCQLKCKDTCLEHGTCDTGPLGTGVCLKCKSGFTGKYCQIDKSSASDISFHILTFALLTTMLLFAFL